MNRNQSAALRDYNLTTEVTLMGIEKDGAYIAGEAPTVSSGNLAVTLAIL